MLGFFSIGTSNFSFETTAFIIEIIYIENANINRRPCSKAESTFHYSGFTHFILALYQ